MEKDLNDITEMDIKRLATRAGLCVSIFNAEIERGIYRYRVLGHTTETEYIIGLTIFESMVNMFQTFLNLENSESVDVVFIYHSHTVREGKLHLKYCCISNPLINLTKSGIVL